MSPELNLASRPFRNERLATLAVALLTVTAVVVTVVHVTLLQQLHSAPARERRAELARLESELRQVRQSQTTVVVADVERGARAKWVAARDVVERRLFSWTLLFSRLEAALPRDVRLVSVTPAIRQEVAVIEVSAEAESVEAGFALVALLEQRPEFADVRPSAINDAEGGGVAMQYRLRYQPAAIRDSEPVEPGS